MVEYRVRIGGLLRCCLQSLAEAMEVSITPPTEGDLHLCKYGKNSVPELIFKDGVWQWNRDEVK